MQTSYDDFYCCLMFFSSMYRHRFAILFSWTNRILTPS